MWSAEDDLIASVMTALEGLGPTSSCVAARLAKKGIGGVRRSPVENPTARYLTSVLGTHKLSVYYDAIWRGDLVLRATPNPVRFFLMDFDAGHFPYLDRQNTERVDVGPWFIARDFLKGREE